MSRAVSLLLLAGASACAAGVPSSADPAPTNATVTFVVPGVDGALSRPLTACLVVAKPGRRPLRNGADADAGAGGVDGRMAFPVGTRANAVVAGYGSLLAQHGWVAGTDFVAAGNSLHFYGITDLAGGASDPQLGVHGATDSDRVPYRDMTPTPK